MIKNNLKEFFGISNARNPNFQIILQIWENKVLIWKYNLELMLAVHSSKHVQILIVILQGEEEKVIFWKIRFSSNRKRMMRVFF